MDKDKVKEILSKINYPGFSRDIVSFGMVSGVEINPNEIVINLSITSQNSEKKSILVGDIEKKLGEYFSSVIVNVEEKVPNVPRCFPLYFPKSPWALSSTIMILCFLATFIISSISHPTPA